MARVRKKAAPTRAERNIAWIEQYCVAPEGRLVGQPIRLRDWQRADIKKIYDNPAGTRLAIISFGKKNGKTSLAACLLLLHLCGPETKPNSQIPSTAQSKDQAAVLFKLAAKMVRMSPALKAVVTIRDTIKELACPEMGTLYKALSAEASTAHGQSPIFAVHDELGQVRGPVSELYNAIENAMGAHESPMSIIISTQAPNDGDLLSLLIDQAKTGADPTIVLSLYAADVDIDPFSDEALKQANPALGDFLSLKEVRKQAENARNIPSQEPLFRNYTLNQRVEMRAPFISRSVWLDGNRLVVPRFDGPVYGGIDLSSTSDLTAKVYVSPVAGDWHVKPTFWLPAEGLAEKSRADRTPYDLWRDQGFLLTTPGRTVEYEFVAQSVWRDCQEMDVRKIAFDRWKWAQFKPWLIKAGFSEKQVEGDDAIFEEFGQGYKSMSPALMITEGDLLAKRVVHGGHPVLTMCVANAVVTSDPAGNRKLDKSKATGRIDGIVAQVMARAVAGTYQTSMPVDIAAMIG